MGRESYLVEQRLWNVYLWVGMILHCHRGWSLVNKINFEALFGILAIINVELCLFLTDLVTVCYSHWRLLFAQDFPIDFRFLQKTIFCCYNESIRVLIKFFPYGINIYLALLKWNFTFFWRLLTLTLLINLAWWIFGNLPVDSTYFQRSNTCIFTHG